MTTGVLYPYTADASILDDVRSFLRGTAEASAESRSSIQSMPLPMPAMNIDPSTGKGGGEVHVVDGAAVVPEVGPAGSIADIDKPKSSTISRYVVREGDTLSGIANMFDVSINTIIWANELPRSGTIRPGQVLVILPITGVKYTVKSGDSLQSLAKQFHADAEEIKQYNRIDSLVVGAEILIPDGEAVQAVAAPKIKGTSPSAKVASGYYRHPLPGAVRTQGIHGFNGVDLAASVGTPITAAAAGEVIISRSSGWNSGYGAYVVIRHDNGTQTLYAHASSVAVGVGEYVAQGQVVAYVGSTGKSTGPHLHFEVRGGPRNPF